MGATHFEGPVVSKNGFSTTEPAAGAAAGTALASPITLTGLPTADPGIPGRLWVDTAAGRVLKVSA